MNQLNSVIIEGEVSGNDLHENFFHIKTIANNKELIFRINVSGKLEEFVKKNIGKTLNEKRSLRIVGRLDTGEFGAFIKAEHIEFKPVFSSLDKN